MNTKLFNSLVSTVLLSACSITYNVSGPVDAERTGISKARGIYYALPKTDVLVSVPVTIKEKVTGKYGQGRWEDCLAICVDEKSVKFDEQGVCVVNRPLSSSDPEYTFGDTVVQTRPTADLEHLYVLDLDFGVFHTANHVVEVTDEGVMSTAKTTVESFVAETIVNTIKALPKALIAPASVMASKLAEETGDETETISCAEFEQVNQDYESLVLARKHLEGITKKVLDEGLSATVNISDYLAFVEKQKAVLAKRTGDHAGVSVETERMDTYTKEDTLTLVAEATPEEGAAYTSEGKCLWRPKESVAWANVELGEEGEAVTKAAELKDAVNKAKKELDDTEIELKEVQPATPSVITAKSADLDTKLKIMGDEIRQINQTAELLIDGLARSEEPLVRRAANEAKKELDDTEIELKEVQPATPSVIAAKSADLDTKLKIMGDEIRQINQTAELLIDGLARSEEPLVRRAAKSFADADEEICTYPDPRIGIIVAATGLIFNISPESYSCGDAPCKEPTGDGGYRYRLAGYGPVVVSAEGAAGEGYGYSARVPVAQYGAIAMLPSKVNGRKSSISLETHADTGSIKKISMGNEALSSTVPADVIGAISELRSVSDSNELQELKDEKERLELEKAILEAKKGIKDAAKALEATQ